MEWGILVNQIKVGEETGMEQLYKLFSRGIRYYLCRQLGPQEFEDKVHDTFLIVVNAIRRGDLREPERLMGFVRTVVRRRVAAYIEQAVHNRREQADLETGVTVADRKQNPEQEAMIRQKAKLMECALSALSEGTATSSFVSISRTTPGTDLPRNGPDRNAIQVTKVPGKGEIRRDRKEKAGH